CAAVRAPAVWPPAVTARAALLVFAYRLWPGVFLGAFFVNVTTAGGIATSLGIAAGNTIEALVGAWLVNRFANGGRAYDRSRDVFRATIFAAGASTLLSAGIGVLTLWAGGLADAASLPAVAFTWWLGDAAGDVVVAPVLVLWATKGALGWTRRQYAEAGLLLMALVLAGLATFGGLLPIDRKHYPVEFLAIPVLLWAAFRFGQ